jgi:D-aminopeptidase
MAACIPTVERTSPRAVAFTKDTVADLYTCFRIVARIGAAAAEPGYA